MANTKITNPELFNLGDSTSATQLPVMTITERIAMNAPITTPFNIDYLVVAGGGAGGGGGQAGGGGAGGLRTNYGGASLTLNTATAYTVTVGAGGIGTGNGVSGSGSNSVFDYITSTITSAGGGGGAIHNISGADGGSGGGAGTQQTGGSGNTPSTTPSQGNAGGSGGTYNFPYSGGGGGGYVSVGSTGGNVSGNGGTGIAYTAANSITGSALSLAGGGGGGTYSGAAGTATNGGGAGFSGTGTTAYGSPGTPGTDNTGGGGGGTGNYQVGTIGASGGSGVVILRYPTADIASYTATGLTPTETTDGTDTILSFTTVGTGAITFTSSTPTGTISTGEMIFNSDTDKVEYWDGTKWYGITYEVTAESPYNNVLYTGTSLTNVITGVGFSPDLVWLKQRNSAQNHGLFDTVRGTNNFIMSNSMSAENTRTTDTLSSFDDDGFTLTPYSSDAFINYTGRTMVAWCFKAGGAAVPNTDGSRPSQVSANVAGGFSIVNWSGNSTNPSTVGHGLGVAPELFIIKNLSSAVNWSVYNSSVGAGNKLQINSSNQASATSNYANTSPTSSVFSLSGGNEVNGSGSNYIAYCFHSVAGLSKVGSYVGNGLTNGPTVALGFEPSFLMCKETTNTGNWRIMDNTRQPSNPKSNGLLANLTNAESASSSNVVDFNSDNFQLVGGGSDVNASGQTYMYLAFA